MSLSVKLIVTVFVTIIGASFQFFTLPVINPVLNILEKWINQTYLDRGTQLASGTLTLLISINSTVMPLGGLVGCLLSRSLIENLGRKRGLILNGVISMLGGSLVGFCKIGRSPEMLFVGRLIFGLSCGLASNLVPMYLTEISPVSMRGSLSSGIQIAVAFGDFMAVFLGLPQILGTENLWPIEFALPAFTAAILVVVLPFSVESPRYLCITKQNTAAAWKSLVFLYGEEQSLEMMEEIEVEAKLLKESEKHQEGVKMSDLALPVLYKPLLLCFVVMIGQQFTGVTAIFSYSTDIFQRAGLNFDSARIATSGVLGAYFLATIPSVYLVEKLGRKWLLLFQYSVCTVSLIVMSISTSLRVDYNYEWASYINIVAVVVYMISYGVGSCIPWMISSELFDQKYRSLAVSMATTLTWFLSAVISLAYLPFQNAVGAALSFIPFTIVLSVCLVILYKYLPETKGKTIAMITSHFVGLQIVNETTPLLK